MTDMNSGKQDNGILKRDVRGRVRTSVRQREMLLDEFERSGLSGPKFSEVAGVCYQTFAGWMRRRRRTRGDRDLSAVPVRTQPGPALVRWVEAETGFADAAGEAAELKRQDGPVMPLTVKLAGGVSVEVSHESQLSLVAELARVLGAHFAKPC